MDIQKLSDKKLLHKIMLYMLPVLLISIIFMIYAKSINYNIIGGDDEKFTILLSEQYNSKGIVKRIFTSNVFPDMAGYCYRPMLTVSFYFDNKISGNKPLLSTSHAVSIALHIISTLLLFYFLKKYYFDLYKSFIASLIFAVSPVIAETVIWLPGRNDSILFIFIILSFMFFIDYNENTKHKKTNLIFHLVFYFIALLTKENAIGFSLLCFYYMIVRKYPEKSKFCAYWFILTLLYFIIRSQITNLSYTWHHIFNFKDFIVNLNMIADYFSSSFFLSGIRTFVPVNALTFIKGISVILLLLFFSVRSPNRRLCIFFFSWAIIFLLPNFFVERAHFQGNRMYVPLMGLIICSAMIFESNIKTGLQKYIFIAVLVLFVSFSIVKTNHRIVNFQNAISFWHHEKMNSNSDWIAHQYALALAKNGYYAESIKELEHLIYDRKNATKKIILDYSLICRLSGNTDKADKILHDFNINSDKNLPKDSSAQSS